MADFIGAGDLSKGESWRAAAAELIATLLFVFIGAGTVVSSSMLGAMDSAQLVAIAVAHGLAIGVMAAATGHLSGGHINPAVTVASVVTRKIGLAKGGLYIIAQLIGASVGAFLLVVVIPEGAQGGLGSHSLGNGVTPAGGLIIEVVLTFVLVFVIFATAVDSRGPGVIAPVAIGFAILIIHLVAVPLTGASVNPARSFGPALAAGQWADHWIYWVGPLVGGSLAAIVYQAVFARKT
ncbi:MAG: MIP family channel protein [Chloroflexi bacterium]|nr:MIP family channel protein [Chloroflexota bacterium]